MSDSFAAAVSAVLSMQDGMQLSSGLNDLPFRVLLLLEEAGEIARALTRGGDAAAEHIDLLIVLIGNLHALGVEDVLDRVITKANEVAASRHVVEVAGYRRAVSSIHHD